MSMINMESIKKEVVVEASQQTAFKTFTDKMDLWWPRTHHVGGSPMTEMVLEPGTGGRWFSKHEDGSEINVGYIISWDPYALLVLAWQINGDFKYDPDLITEVEVRFLADGPKQTMVKFEHKNLDKLRTGGKAVDSMDEGWGYILNLYKNVISQL